MTGEAIKRHIADATPMTGSFTVPGLPATKGSSVSFMGKSGKMVHKASCKRLGGWQRAVANAVSLQQPRTGPVWLQVEFRLPRPKSHYVNGDGVRLKPAALVPHSKKPDIDKLLRALLDGLTGALYVDDSQVVRVSAAKRYVNADETGAAVTWGEMFDVGWCLPVETNQEQQTGISGEFDDVVVNGLPLRQHPEPARSRLAAALLAAERGGAR